MGLEVVKLCLDEAMKGLTWLIQGDHTHAEKQAGKRNTAFHLTPSEFKFKDESAKKKKDFHDSWSTNSLEINIDLKVTK